jgi:DNA-binding MarR family transcriptional regulator
VTSETKTGVDFAVDQNREIAMRIGKVWREIRRGAANSKLRGLIFENADFAIDPGQFDTLERIVMHETIRMGDLADSMHIDPSTATRAVQRLIKDGLAHRVNHEGDGRVVVIAPTDLGRRVFESVVERRKQMVVRVMEQFSADERLVLADMLERFSDALGVAVADLSKNS